MKLVYTANQVEVSKGDTVTLRDGHYTVVDWEKPRHAASTGRIYVKPLGGGREDSFFPSVCGAEWIEREDRD